MITRCGVGSAVLVPVTEALTAQTGSWTGQGRALCISDAGLASLRWLSLCMCPMSTDACGWVDRWTIGRLIDGR